MNITDLYSMRQKHLRGEVPDVFQYEFIPDPLRVQIVQILSDVLGDVDCHDPKCKSTYEYIVKTLCREYGVHELDQGARGRLVATKLFHFIEQEHSTERVLDAVELAFRMVDVVAREQWYLQRTNANDLADSAINELNIRFQQQGVGYRFESREIIRIDSELLHAEVVKPALQLLHDPKFKGPEAEFLLSHEHYRHGRTKEAITECLKSLESTIKVIAAKHHWQHELNATAKPLLDLMFQKELIPLFWQQQFGGLRAILENGVPTGRNRLGGHGQGGEIVDVPAHIVAFILHQTAAAIVFLVSAEKSLPQ